MMFRLAACGAVLTGCGYLGIVFGAQCKKRPEQLSEIRRALEQLEFDVDFLNITLCEAFGKIVSGSTGGVKSVFTYVMNRLKEKRCTNMKTCWEKAMRIYGSELYLNDSDKKILLDFAKNLGAGSRESELNNIKATDMRLKIAESEAYSEAKRNSKMYRGLGFLCGVFLVIIFI